MKAKMKIKKVLIFLVALMFIFSQGIFVFAETLQFTNQSETRRDIKPMWDNTNNISLDLYFTNNNAECVGTIRGIASTTKISATFMLEKKGLFGWSFVDSWTESVDGRTLSFYGTAPVTKGTYRLSVTAKVTANGTTETATTSVQGVN